MACEGKKFHTVLSLMAWPDRCQGYATGGTLGYPITVQIKMSQSIHTLNIQIDTKSLELIMQHQIAHISKLNEPTGLFHYG